MNGRAVFHSLNDCWQRLLFWTGAFLLSLLPAFYLMTDAASNASKLSFASLYSDHYTTFMPALVAFLSVACLNGYDIQRRMPTQSISHAMVLLVLIPTLAFTVWTAMHYGAYLQFTDGAVRNNIGAKTIDKIDRWFIWVGIVLCVLVEITLALVAALPTPRPPQMVTQPGHGPN
jgi:hypothetical protein